MRIYIITGRPIFDSKWQLNISNLSILICIQIFLKKNKINVLKLSKDHTTPQLPSEFIQMEYNAYYFNSYTVIDVI